MVLQKRGLAFFAVLLVLPEAYAFQLRGDDWSGSFDTTLSLGMQWRVQKRASDLIDRNVGGSRQNAQNGDDGDLNFGRGLNSLALKATHELQLDRGNYGVFFRGTYFYDPVLDSKDALSGTAKSQVARDANLLDAYVRGDFNPDGHKLQMRLGWQVVSWGESTFIPGGINVINPFDLAKFRVPGAEVREALKPTPMLWGSGSLAPGLNLEALYIAKFEPTRLDPRGSYFSTNDVISDGSGSLVGGFGVPDQNGNIPNRGITDGRFLIPRLADRKARDGGEYGLALRWFSHYWNDAEFALYYLNTHSRFPVVNFIANAPGQFPNAARYFAEYPEDIHLYGASFSTNLGDSGIALQGEFSYRPNAPLQILFSEVALAGTNTLIAGQPASQLGSVGPGAEVIGYRRLKLGQAQFTLTKNFGTVNPFGSDQWIVVGEVGAVDVFNLPSQSVLRFDAPGTFLPARAGVAVAGTPIPAQSGGYATEFSWGYRLLTTLGYTNAIGPVSLTPRIAFAHDVNGITPGPPGVFIKGRKSLVLGINASYQERWSFDLSYARFFGNNVQNLIHDRDFISATVKFDF